MIAPDYSTADVLARDRALIFANDAEPALAETITGGMVKEPLAPLAIPITLTTERFGTVPKAYVKTLRDNALGTALQDRMIARASITSVLSIDSSHTPQITHAADLAALIQGLAKD